MTVSLFIRVFLFFLGYLESIIGTYVFVVIFCLILVLTIDTPFEEILVKLLSIIPGIGLGKDGNFNINVESITVLFLVWGIVVFLISSVIQKYTRIKISFGLGKLLIFGLVLHIASLLVLSTRVGFGHSAVFVGILFVTYSLSILVSNKINLFRKVLSMLLDDV